LNVKNGKKTRRAKWEGFNIGCQGLKVLGNQNSHNQTLVDIKTMFSKFLEKLKDHATIPTPFESNYGCEH
jgi:hypothetical protein